MILTIKELWKVFTSRLAVRVAAELDQGIFEDLKNKFRSILKYVPAELPDYLEPEIDLLLKTIMWMLSVERSFATFGQQLLYLEYDNQATLFRLRVLGALRIGSSYIRQRSISYLASLPPDKALVMDINRAKQTVTAIQELFLYNEKENSNTTNSLGSLNFNLSYLLIFVCVCKILILFIRCNLV